MASTVVSALPWFRRIFERLEAPRTNDLPSPRPVVPFRSFRSLAAARKHVARLGGPPFRVRSRRMTHRRRIWQAAWAGPAGGMRVE